MSTSPPSTVPRFQNPNSSEACAHTHTHTHTIHIHTYTIHIHPWNEHYTIQWKSCTSQSKCLECMVYPESVVSKGSKVDDDTEDRSDTVLASSVITNKQKQDTDCIIVHQFSLNICLNLLKTCLRSFSWDLPALEKHTVKISNKYWSSGLPTEPVPHHPITNTELSGFHHYQLWKNTLHNNYRINTKLSGFPSLQALEEHIA